MWSDANLYMQEDNSHMRVEENLHMWRDISHMWGNSNLYIQGAGRPGWKPRPPNENLPTVLKRRGNVKRKLRNYIGEPYSVNREVLLLLLLLLLVENRQVLLFSAEVGV